MKLILQKELSNNWKYLEINNKNVTFHDIHADGIHYNLQTGFGEDVKSKEQKEQDIKDDEEVKNFLNKHKIPFKIKENGSLGPRLVIERKYFKLNK